MDSEQLGMDPSGISPNDDGMLSETEKKRMLAELERKYGKLAPQRGGWRALQKRGKDMQEVVKIESKLRSERDKEQTEDGMTHSTVAGLDPQELVPIDPVRLDRKNYPIWSQRMEFFLKELKVEYVLYEPCPSIMLGSEASTEETDESKAAEQKWMKDDLLCLRTILTYLSDDLLQRYSKKEKSTTAKELWEELKLIFGTTRSLVIKYMEFQMLEEKPIVEQVQEFNRIFDSVLASKMAVTEKFHVTAILTKLPASWKDVSIKLMRESLPLEALMDRLRVEEESRIKKKHNYILKGTMD